MAPEYTLLSSIVSTEQRESVCYCFLSNLPFSFSNVGNSRTMNLTIQVEEYQDIASRKSDLERTELQKEKTGVFSGCYAKNPTSGEPIPIWVADYVLGRCV